MKFHLQDLTSGSFFFPTVIAMTNLKSTVTAQHWKVVLGFDLNWPILCSLEQTEIHVHGTFMILKDNSKNTMILPWQMYWPITLTKSIYSHVFWTWYYAILGWYHGILEPKTMVVQYKWYFLINVFVIIGTSNTNGTSMGTQLRHNAEVNKTLWPDQTEAEVKKKLN